MIDPLQVPPVDPSERLTRFLLSKRQIRQDGTIRPEAFIPKPYLELSVTRHRDASETEIWEIGNAVANAQQKILHGRRRPFIERPWADGGSFLRCFLSWFCTKWAE